MARHKEWDFAYSSSRKLFYRVPGTELYPLGIYNNENRQKIRLIAQDEFHLLAEQHHLKYSKKKYTLHIEEDKEFLGRNSVFGVNLQSLLNSDRRRDPQCALPLAVEMLFQMLEFHGYKKDGTMRLSPKKSSATAVKTAMAKDFYGRRKEIEELLESNEVHLTANIIKFFMRCVPNSVFTRDFADAFLKTSDIVSKFDRVKAMKLLIMQLPEANADVLHEYLLQLIKLIDNQEHTRMTADGLARVVTTSLFYVTDAQMDFGNKNLEDCPPFNLVLMMLENVDLFFTVPPFIDKAIEGPDLQRRIENLRKTKRAKHFFLKSKHFGKSKKPKVGSVRGAVEI